VTRDKNNETYKVMTSQAAVKLDANENPYSLVGDIYDEILERAAGLDPARYPDYELRAVKKQLAAYTGLDSQCLVVGNGADELIQLVLLAFSKQVSTLVVPSPTFIMYRVAASAVGLEVCEVPLGPNFELMGGDVCDCVGDEAGVVLCMPNNPTGNYYDAEAVQQVLNSTARFIVIDEAYYEFCDRTQLELIEADERVVVLRTLSKAFGLAGLRVGYAAAHPKTAELLRKVKQPYNVGAFAQLAAAVVLERAEEQLQTAALLNSERERTTGAAARIPGLEPLPSRTNFFLLHVDAEQFGQGAAAVNEALRELDIAVRYYPDEPRLEDYLRISVGSESENDQLIRALKRLQTGSSHAGAEQ
jgi:histidinol-phosphate aminotransferase